MSTISLNVHPNEEFWRRWSFPGGEVGLAIADPTLPPPVLLQARINTPAQLMDLILAEDALSENYGHLPALRIGYLPYARQDRYDTKGSSFALKQILKVLGTLRFPQIEVLDIHSQVAQIVAPPNLHLYEIKPKNYFDQYLRELHLDPSNAILVVPDAGARERCMSLGAFKDVVFCSKVRDSETGKLSGFNIENKRTIRDHSPYDNYIIADDICDGGGTFLGVADALIECFNSFGHRDPYLHLFVSHGIFSGPALDRLFKKFDTIGTTNSWQNFAGLTDNLLVIPYFS